MQRHGGWGSTVEEGTEGDAIGMREGVCGCAVSSRFQGSWVFLQSSGGGFTGLDKGGCRRVDTGGCSKVFTHLGVSVTVESRNASECTNNTLTRPKSSSNALSLCVCSLQGDYVEILIITKDGIRREELTLKLD